MKDNGLTALSRQTDVAIFALPIIVPSEEVCDARMLHACSYAGFKKCILNFKYISSFAIISNNKSITLQSDALHHLNHAASNRVNDVTNKEPFA